VGLRRVNAAANPGAELQAVCRSRCPMTTWTAVVCAARLPFLPQSHARRA